MTYDFFIYSAVFYKALSLKLKNKILADFKKQPVFRIGLRHTFDTCGMKKQGNKTTMFFMDYTTFNGEFKQMNWSRCNRLMFNYFVRLV